MQEAKLDESKQSKFKTYKPVKAVQAQVTDAGLDNYLLY
jgi:hypothetical protein